MCMRNGFGSGNKIDQSAHNIIFLLVSFDESLNREKCVGRNMTKDILI